MYVEEEPSGDGVNGFYYDNEDFQGNPIVKESEDINFDWSGESPIDKINHENFSVRWEGYLKVPVTGTYKFTTISDDGNEFYINKKKIITHNMASMNNPQMTWMEAMHSENDAAKKEKQSKAI